MNEHAFLFGLEPSIDSALMPTSEAFKRVGENTGNLAFVTAVKTYLQLSKVVNWTANPADIRAAGTIAVMPCANQIGAHMNMGWLGEQIEKTDVKVVAIGLGAQAGLNFEIPAIPDGTIRWLNAIAERSPAGAPNISVRGAFSYQVLESIGLGKAAVPLGCPSLFINPDPALGRKIAERLNSIERIAVVAGHYRWAHLGKLEASLAALANATGGAYIVQSPLEMVSLARGRIEEVEDGFLEQCRNYCMPHMSKGQFLRWAHERTRVFFNVPSWMEYLTKFDFVIGARIHGVMLALQAGVPALCIAHDTRTTELCQIMRVPFVNVRDVINGIKRDELLKTVKFDPEEFDKNRSLLAQRFVDFLEANDLKATIDATGENSG